MEDKILSCFIMLITADAADRIHDCQIVNRFEALILVYSIFNSFIFMP